MGFSPKKKLQQMLHEKALNQYENELKLQKDSYAAFLRSHEPGGVKPVTYTFFENDGEEKKNVGMSGHKGEETANSGMVEIVPSEKLSAWLGNANLFEEQTKNMKYILCGNGAGYFSKEFLNRIWDKFEQEKESKDNCANDNYANDNLCELLYCHWDKIDSNGHRHTPMFLPEWSPDTLASHFYMENCFAVRVDSLRERLPLLEQVPEKDRLYLAALLLTGKHAGQLIDVVGFHKLVEKDFVKNSAADKSNKKTENIEEREEPVEQSNSHGDSSLRIDNVLSFFKTEETEILGFWERFASRKEAMKDSQISIIIPSKDHPKVLERCVASIRKFTENNPEIIVVDNGSGDKNRTHYHKLSEEYHFTYEYCPMEFNFSCMCNLGAGLAKGNYYLFLNDDMEILDFAWLDRLLEIAVLEHVGAVGAKLLYPDSTRIQHAGITNMYQGPAHKLLQYDDTESYYGGRNRGMWDMIGVTAACLLISKEKFDLLGGLSEELKVAYNDVDFCFRLHQKGFYNVQRNDVTLYHHESLSRGNDLIDPEKYKRLMEERRCLYGRNEGYYDYDPFYSRHLTGVSEVYECCLPYENRNVPMCEELRLISKEKREWQKIQNHIAGRNETLIIRVDAARKEEFALQGEEKGYLIDLHAHVRGLDSCDYEYKMYLVGKNQAYEVPATRRFRPDVSKNLDKEIHVELSGFVAKISPGDLVEDTYEIWMSAKSVFSRQCLWNRAEEVLIVKETGNVK